MIEVRSFIGSAGPDDPVALDNVEDDDLARSAPAPLAFACSTEGRYVIFKTAFERIA